MSTIDERVVEMRFDNDQFERNVATSLSTLDKLKAALKLDGSTKGIEELQKSTNSFNMNPLINAVSEVNDKFSALNIIGTTALVNITNKAINAGEALVKSLSVDNISAGWDKFGEKTQSVATLVSQGYDLSTVEEQMERLNWFTDETSYNFTDMVSNISKFTASGQQLEPSVTAMMGIANWAAMCGQNATTASRAMYQLSQAMGKGVLKYDDWKSIQNASMDTVEFRKQAVKAAAELGKIKQVGEDAYEIIGGKKAEKFSLAELFTSDALSRSQWFTSDVMMKTFGQYSAAVDEIYDHVNSHEGMLASEAMEELDGKIDEFGLKAFKAAQQARTFRDVIDATKDAVSTGWMNTFEYIFGNYEEATELWSGLAEVFYDVFAAGGEARNEMFKLWKDMGGRDILLKAIANGFENIKKVVEPLNIALKDFIPQSITERAKMLKNATANLLYFVNNLSISSKASENLTDAFRGVFSFIGLLVDGFKTLTYVLSPLLVPLNVLAGYFVELLGAIGRAVTGFRNFTHTSSDVASSVERARDAVKWFAYNLTKAIVYVAEFIKRAIKFVDLNKAIKTFNGYIKNMATRIAPYFNKVTKVVDNVIKKFTSLFNLADIKSGFSSALTKIGTKFNELGTIAGKAFNKILPYFNTAKAKVVEFFNTLSSGTSKIQFSDIIEKVGDVVSKVGEKFGEAKDFVIKFIEDVKNAESPLEVLKKIFDDLKTKISDFAKVVEQFAKDNGIIELKDKFINSFNAIIDKLKELGAARVLMFVFGVAVTAMMLEIANAASKAAGLFYNLNLIPDAISKAIRQFTRLSATNSILQVAEAIGILALSLKLVSTIDSAKLGECAAALLLLSFAMAAIAAIMNRFGSDSGFAANAVGIVALTGSILLLAVSLALLEKIEFKHLLQSMEILGAFALALVAVSRLMSFASAANAFNVAMLLAFAFSMEKITNAFVKLSNEIDPKVADQALETLKAMMIGLGAIAFAAKGVGIGSALGLIGIIVSLDMLYGMMRKIAESDIDMNFIKQNIEKFEAVFVVLAGLFLAARIAGKGGLGAAALILAIGASMTLLVGVLERLEDLNFRMASSHWQATLMTFVVMMGLLGVLMLTVSYAGKDSLKGAVAVIAISACMYLLLGIIEQLDALTFAMTKAGTYEQTIKTLVGIVVALGALMALSALTGKAKVSALFMIMASIGILIAGMAILSDASLDQDRMIKVATGMAIVMAGLGVCFLLAGNLAGIANTGAMMAVTGAMLVLIGGLIILTQMATTMDDPMVLIQAAGAIGIVLLAFGFTMELLASAAATAMLALPGAQAILIVALAMIPMAAALTLLAFAFNSVSTEAIATSIAGMILVMFAMAGAANMAIAAMTGAAAMVVMSASLLIAAVSLGALALIPEDRLNHALIAIGLILGAFAALGAASMFTGGVFSAGLITVAHALGIFALALIGIAAAALIFSVAVNMIVEALKSLAGITDEEANQIGENIIKIMGDIGTGLGEGIKNLAKSLWEGVKELFNNLKQYFSGNKEGLKTSARGAFDGVVSALAEMGTSALAALGELLAGLISAIASKAGDFLKGAKDSFLQFTEGIRQSISDAINAAKEFIDKIVQTIKDKAKDFKDAAVNCVQGFINGFGSMIGDAIDAVKGFAGDVLSVFNVTLGNNSPSKKFSESGYFCVAGFKQGITKNTGMAEKAMRGLAKDGMDAFNDYMGIHSNSDRMIDEMQYVTGGGGEGVEKYADKFTKPMENLAKDGFEKFGSTAKEGIGEVGKMIPEEITKTVGGELNGFTFTGNALTYKGLFDMSDAQKRTEKELAEIEAKRKKDNHDVYHGLSKDQKKAEDTTKEYTKATEGAANAVSGLGSASSAAAASTGEVAKQVDTLTDIMDYAGNAVGIFNNHWAMSQDNMTNTMAFQASKDAMELLAFQLYEVSIASETAEEAAERMGKSQLEIAADIKAAYLDMRNGVVNTLKGQIDLFKMADFGEKKKGGDLLEMARSQDRLGTSFEQSFQTLAERVAGLDGAEELMRHFADEGMSSMGDLSSVLDMTADELKEFAGYAEKYYGNAQTYEDMADRMMASIGYVTYKAAGGFAEGLDPKTAEEAFENFTAAGLQKMYDKFGMSIQSGRSETMAAIAQELSESFAEGLNENDATKTTEDTAITIVEAMGDVVNQDSGKECAIDFCQGIVNGIEDGTGPVFEAVTELGEGMVESLMDATESHSPSRAAERIGRFFDLGLVNGLVEYGTRVKDAVTETAFSAVDGFESVFNHIADMIDGTIDLDPTIRPVLDLTNLQYGASQIGGLLGLNDPYALNATASLSGIQNDATLISGLTSSLKTAIDGMKSDSEIPPVTINIYATENQDAEEIANYTAWKLNHDVFKRRAVHGGV